MEKQPMKIGDQEFERVGEMKSEDTELEDAPKSFELYRDVESGSLMGKLPENHPVEELRKENINKAIIEQKIENLDIDLTKLTLKEIRDLLKPGVKIYGKSKVGTDPRYEPSKYEGDLSVVGEYIYVDGQGKVYYIPGLPGHEYKSPECKILKNKILIDTSHIYDGNMSRADDHIEFSFYEIPEGYKELMEKKEGKAE